MALLEVQLGDPPYLYGFADGRYLRTSALNPEGWTEVNVPSEAGVVRALSLHPSDPNVFAVVGDGGVFATFDGGSSWVPLHEAGHMIGNTLYQGLPVARYSGGRPVVVSTGSPWTICIGSDTGGWCHRGLTQD